MEPRKLFSVGDFARKRRKKPGKLVCPLPVAFAMLPAQPAQGEFIMSESSSQNDSGKPEKTPEELQEIVAGWEQTLDAIEQELEQSSDPESPGN